MLFIFYLILFMQLFNFNYKKQNLFKKNVFDSLLLDNILYISFPKEEGLVIIAEGDEDVGEESFQRSLAGKLWTESPFNIRAFKQTIVDAWKLKWSVEVQELAKNLFLFIFSTKRDLDNVISSGPWSFNRNILVLKRITRIEQPSEMALDTTSLWARVYDLPLRLRSVAMATRLGNMMGGF